MNEILLTVAVLSTTLLFVAIGALLRVARQRDYFRESACQWYDAWKEERDEFNAIRDEADWWKR